ncbi:ABC transporter ATP-binding protein [Dyadobacter pollutisoli]|uniref:ATP-binding cassette domain-containing protein n=1 Tax=Dyadobacter pollutisoli TaxID=2910158 RepID=A0A9E8SN50_9BACT|nr:ATP-binding cassette domain-containing protein [Dyadobacter pollutisoli]WAC14883.1 ATP-binding cassette domain-containing protein [Dyadobacter pollutisoli]
MTYAIQTNQLSYSRRGQLIVDNLSLRVPAGSIFGFLGPNGSGKTTTIRLLLGLIQTQKPCIQIFGQQLHEHRLPILQKIGALIEAPVLYPHLSGGENMEIGRLARRVEREQTGCVLEMVGLAGEAKRRVRTYSLGMRQRLGIALALLGDPDLLILDEPTNGLDPAGIREMRRMLAELSEVHGKTIFISSHLLDEMEKLVTHVGILNHGNLLFQGPMAQLHADFTAGATLEEIFLNLTNDRI